MPMIEAEMRVAQFGGFVQTLASAGPIPVGTLNGLGPARLISAITWNSVEIGPAPSGFSAPPGMLSARAPLTLQHVSIAELDVNPNAPGALASATGWLTISANLTELQVNLIAVDIAGAATQFFPSPIRVARRAIPEVAEVAGGVPISGTALLLQDNIVTLRYATKPSDPLFAMPLNVLNQTPEAQWAIRVSGEALADELFRAMGEALTPPPGGTVIEDDLTASWVCVDGQWVAEGVVGLEKPDACWGLFEDTDISVTVTATLRFSPDTSPNPPMLNMQLYINGNASDWDSFRCWLGSAGLGSLVLGGFIGPIVGVVAGVVSLIAVAETIRLDAGRPVAGVSINDPFVQVSSDENSATYAGTRPLPTLAAVGFGSTNTATVGPLGLIVTGGIGFLSATHVVTFTPDGGILPARFSRTFSCNQSAWVTKPVVQGIDISDRAKVLSLDLGLVPVTVFPSSAAVPANLWSIAILVPSLSQSVPIVGSSAVQAGDQGRIYLHTSAGIRRYDIPPFAALADISRWEQIDAIARCKRFTKEFMAWEEIKWLVDPPPFDYGYPPLRQWLFTFAEIPAATRISVHRLRNGERVGEPITYQATKAGEAAIEIVTDEATELVVEHNQEPIARVRTHQRWLMPTQFIAVGGTPTSLVRSGTTICAVRKGGLVSVNLQSGLISHQTGNLTLSKSRSGALVAAETRTFVVGNLSRHAVEPVETHLASSARPPVMTSHPFSLTLPDGKVVAAVDDRLVIAIPWGRAGVIAQSVR